MKEKFLELCKDPEFVKKLNSLKSEKEVVDFLNERGIQVKSLAELKTAVEPDPKALDPEELKQVAGGGACFVVGIGFDAAACALSGSCATGDDSVNGIGATACLTLGVGFGAVCCPAYSISLFN